MKIVQINAVCGYGSTGRTCVELSEKMTEKGIENYIFYGNKKSDYSLGERINSDFDVKFHGILSRITGKQAYFSVFATKRLIKRLKQIKPDVVHLHNMHGNYINLNMLLKYLAKEDIATVITIHDCWFFTGKCTHYTMDKCYKWQDGCYSCPRIKKDNVSWFFDRTKKMWKDKNRLLNALPRLAVIGVSDWTANEAKKSPFFKNATEIKRIYNWIDLNAFVPRKENIKEKYGIVNDKFIVLLVAGGWVKESDKFNDVLKLSAMADEDIHIVMVGGGLEKEALPENVTKIDYINGTEELSKVYSMADVYVHVSREDTFGKVIAEAIACGTPAVVYNSTALPELIGDGCGYIAECENVDEIYEKIQLVKKNTKEFYREKCVRFARKNFEKNKLADEMIEVYRELIGKMKR